MEQVLVVVQRQRPESLDGRLLPGRERHLVRLLTHHRRARGVVVGVEVLRLGGPVVEHVRSRGARSVEVVDAELRVVGGTIPAVARGPTIVSPLEERSDDIALGGHSGVHENLLDVGILVGRVQHRPHLRVERFFAWQGGNLIQYGADLIEELFRNNPFRFTAAGIGRRPGDDGSLGPIGGLHLSVEIAKWIDVDLVDYRLNRRSVLGCVVHEHSRYRVGQRGGAPDHGLHAVGGVPLPVRSGQ